MLVFRIYASVCEFSSFGLYDMLLNLITPVLYHLLSMYNEKLGQKLLSSSFLFTFSSSLFAFLCLYFLLLFLN